MDDYDPDMSGELADMPSESSSAPLLTQYLPYRAFERQQALQHEYQKNVGTFDSYIYVFSQNFGFALVALPLVFQQAGLLLTTLALIVFSIISNWTPLLLTEAQALIPGNGHFELNVEYLGIARYYLKRGVYLLFHVILNVYYLTVNILNIRISCGALDSFIVLCFGHTYGIVLYPQFSFQTISDPSYFYNEQIVIGISISYILLMAIFATLSFCDLKDNIRVQTCCIAINFICIGVVVWTFFHLGLEWHRVSILPLRTSNLIGSMIFSMGYAGSIPAWINSTKSHVRRTKILVYSALFVTFLNILLPLMAAYSFEHVQSEDFMQQLASSQFKITKIAVYMYTLTIITTNIPFLSIVVKRNLYNSDLTGRRMSQFIAIGMPWIVGFLFNSGKTFLVLLNTTSLLLGGFSGFYIPCVLYYIAQKRHLRLFKSPANTQDTIPTWILSYWKPVVLSMIISVIVMSALQFGIDAVTMIRALL